MIRMHTAQGNAELSSLKCATKSSLKTTMGVLRCVAIRMVLGAAERDNH
jgi:hypothetical protein